MGKKNKKKPQASPEAGLSQKTQTLVANPSESKNKEPAVQSTSKEHKEPNPKKASETTTTTEVKESNTKPTKELTEAQKARRAELEKAIHEKMAEVRAKGLNAAPMKRGAGPSEQQPSTSEAETNPAGPAPKLSLKDLMASVAKLGAGGDQKNKPTGSPSLSDDSLKKDLTALLKNSKLEDVIKKSNLGMSFVY